MSKVEKYAELSPIMEIRIKMGDENFIFNLTKELVINESGLKKELLSQPSAYGFITLLHKSLLKRLGDLKVNEKKAYAHAYIKHKREISQETKRPNSDDVAKQKAELDKKYLLAQRQVISTQYDVNRLETCVRAFEQRANMLQTLSANLRKEL